MSDTSNSNNDVHVNVNMEGNAAQQAAELSAQIVNLSQHLATLSQRAVQNANVTKAFNQSMGLSASGVSQYSREITQSLNPLGRMTRAVEIQKRVLDEATSSARAYSAAQKMLNQGSTDPLTLNRSNAAMSQSVKHMNAMRLSSNDLQKAMKQVALLDYSRKMSANAMEKQYSAYNFFRNFSLPLITGLREAFFSYSKLATESNRTTKLILDNFNQIGLGGNFEGQVKAARAFTKELGKDLDKITRDWGTSRVLIQSLAGDFAELGISSRIVLADLTRMTAETEKLGNLDISQSSEFIQTMYQTILRIRRETGKSVDINSDQVANEVISQLRGQLAVFNMVENKTVMSLRNIADAFPEVTAAATSFGLSMTEAMSLVIPMIGAGFQVGASANSVKVSLQRMVAMTKQNTQIINQLNAEMGTGFKYSAGVGMENIQMLTDAYRTLSKSVSDGGKGKQGALEFFSRLFGVRQGPRMETAFAQLAAFQTGLETYGSVERKTADILQNSINVELAAIGSKKIAINQFLDLSNIHRMAIEKDSRDVLTAQAQAIQKGQKTAQKLLESANSKNSDFISGMSTEVGKALMAQAFDVQSLAGKQFEAELKISQDTPEVRYRRAKESLMALGRAVVPVVDVFLKGLLPVLEKLAAFLQNNPFVAKLASALLGIIALSGPIRLIFTTIQTAFGGAVGIFVKLSRIISGTSLQFASLQDLIMNPNLLRGQQRVVQYLDGFLIKSKRGARELKEAYDFSGISLPAKEAIQAGGIYGSDKAVNMKRMQPFVPQTDKFMNDLKTINAQSSAQMAAKVAAGAESGVTKGAANLSDDIVAQFANAMHRFQGPNLFAGPNYFEGNVPFGGSSGGPGSTGTPRTPRTPRTPSGAAVDDLTPDESALAVAKNEARRARLRPPIITNYPKGTLFPTSTAKSFKQLNNIIDSKVRRESLSKLFIPANATAGAMQAASAVAKPQAPFNPAQLLSNISQNRIALGRDPLGPVAIQRFLSRAGDNVKLSFDQIQEWYVQAGKPISDQLEYAFSKGGVFTVSKGTLDAVKTKIFDKTKQGVFTLATGEEGIDKRLKGLASIRGFRNMGKTVQAELVPVIASVSDSIAEQVNVGLNQSLATLNELKLDNMLRTPMGATGGVINDLTAGKPVLVDDIKRAIEDHFIAAESITNGVVKQSSTTVVNSLKDIDKLLPNIVDEIDVIANEAGPLSSYGDDLRKAFRNVRAKTHSFVESVNASGQRMVTLVKNEVLVPGNDAQVQLRAADEAARKAFGSGSDVLDADAAAKKAVAEAKIKPDYVLNKKIEEARLKIQKLREAKVSALSRVRDVTPPLPTTEPVLVGRLAALDEAIKEQNDEIQKEIKRFKAAKAELNSVISQETDLQTSKTGKSRVRQAGKKRMQELQDDHDFELNFLRKHQATVIRDRDRVLNSPAAIQRQIDDTLAALPKDVRAAVQDVDRAISDEMKQLSMRTESRLSRMKRALTGVGRADATEIRAAVPMNPMWNAVKQQIPMGSDGSPLDAFRYSGSRFFNDTRFQQPNARMFDARRGLSLPTSIKSFFGMDRVKGVFRAPKSLSAAAITQGEQIIFQFADQLETQLGSVLANTAQADIKHITRVLQNLKPTSVSRDLATFMTSIVNLPQDQIEMAMGNTLTEIKRTITTATGAGVGGKGMKSGSLQSWKAFLERMRRGSQGLDADASGNPIVKGIREFFFSGKIKKGAINTTSAAGISAALESAFVASMKGGFEGLGGADDAGITQVARRLTVESNRPGLGRQRAAKKAFKDVGKKATDAVKGIANDIEGFLTAPAAVMADIASKVDMAGAKSSSMIRAATDKVMKPIVKVYKPGELFPGRAPSIIPAVAASTSPVVSPTPATVKSLKNTGIELPATKRQAEKMMESAQRELARQLGIDAKASGASAKIKKLSVASFEKEIERLQGMIAGEQKLLDTFTSPGMRKGPERNLAKLNKQIKELAFARDKYVVAEYALADLASKVTPAAPSSITPTGATGATAPTAPPPRIPTTTAPVMPTPVTPVIPTPVTPSATGGAGKIIDIKKLGQVFKGPNLFQGPNIFDSNLSNLIPNFDELLSPVGEAAETMADAGDEVATSLSRVLAAGEARKLTGNLVGPGDVGEASRLSRTRSRLFGRRGVDVPSITAGLDAAQITKTAGLVDALAKKKLRLKFDDAGALIGMSRIKKLGGEMAISFDRANSILAGRLLPNFTRFKKLFSSGIVKGWAFALTGGLSAAVKPAQSLLKAITATGEASMRGKARAAIDTLVESRDGKKTGFVRKTMAGLSGATGGINSLAAAGSKAADIMFKIGSAIAMIGTVAVIALPIIVLMFGIFQAWKSAQGRLGATTEALKQSLTNLKDAVVALFAPIRDMINGFLGAGSVGSTFMTQGEKNAAMFYGIATAIKRATEFMKKWAETTGKAFMTNKVAPFLTRLINRFILLGGAIKSAFSGDKEAAGKKLKAFLYSLIYELLNFTKGITDVIAVILKGLIPVMVTIAKVGLVVFREMFKELVIMAADAAGGVSRFLTSAIFGPTYSDAYFKYVGDPFASFAKGDGFKIRGKQSSEEFADSFSTGLSGKLDKLIDPIKGGLDSSLTKGMSEVAKKYAELMGQGINIPLAQKIKNPKAFQDALAYNAKKSADAATAAGESLGGNVNKGIKDKMKEIKDTVKGYFYSNVDAKFEDIIQQYIDALTNQKDEQLKAYDDQIAGIDALAEAEERLTAKKEYETKRREMIDQRETDRENYLVERRLAVYEGRAFDVRKLDREELLAQRNSAQEIKELDSGRLSQLQSEQRDLAKQAISNQKDLAEKQFDLILKSFDEFIKGVKNKSFSTQVEFAAALQGVADRALSSSLQLGHAFEDGLAKLPAAIAAVRDPALAMFSASMSDLINEAAISFGVNTKSKDPKSLLGAVGLMASGVEQGFKDAFSTTFAPLYVKPAVDAITLITSSLSKKGDPNNIAESWTKAGKDAFEALEAELNRTIAWEKIFKSFDDLFTGLKPKIKKVVDLAGEAQNALANVGGQTGVSTELSADTMKEFKAVVAQSAAVYGGGKFGTSKASLDIMVDRVAKFIGTHISEGAAGIIASAKSANSGLSVTEQGILTAAVGKLNIGGALNLIANAGAYRTDSQGRSGFGSTASFLPNFAPSGYMYGGSVRKYGMGGYLEAPASQGIPALLHGGEYIINHKAVEKFGKGNLEKINALRNGGDLKGFASGGYMTVPGFANGGYMTIPGFANGGYMTIPGFAKGGSVRKYGVEDQKAILALRKPQPLQGPYATSIPMLAQRTIDLNKLPQVPNKNGGMSTISSASFGLTNKAKGPSILLPTVFKNQIDYSKELIPTLNEFKKTGRHLGVYPSLDASTLAASVLHLSEENRIGKVNSPFAKFGLSNITKSTQALPPEKKEGLSWWKEILRPKNSFAMIGAIAGGILGGLGGFGFGAVPGSAGGAAIGGGFGSFVEQLFDSKKGFQPLDIAKNAALQGTFDLVGGMLIKNVAAPFLRAKFPGVGTYLEGTIARPILNLFKKPGVDAIDSTLLNPANVFDTQIAQPKITLPSLTSGTKGGDLVPFSVKAPRILPVAEKGNAPAILDTFRGAGAKFDKQVLDLFDELDALTLGQTENLATVTRREMLRTQLQLRGAIPKVMQSPEELAFYNNMLNDLLGVFRNNNEGIGAHGGLLDWDIAGGFAEDLGITFSRPTPGNIDPRIIPGSREVFDFQFQQIKIAEQIGDLLRDSDGVIPPDLRSSVTGALGLKPSSGQFLESTPWLHLPRQNQPLYRNEWMDSLYDEAQLAANALKDQMALAPKQLTAGTKGGALVPFNAKKNSALTALEAIRAGMKNPSALAIPEVKYLPKAEIGMPEPIGSTFLSNTAFLNSLNNPVEAISEFIQGVMQNDMAYKWKGNFFRGFDPLNPLGIASSGNASTAFGFNTQLPRKAFTTLPKNTELIHANAYAIYDAAFGLGGLDRSLISELSPTTMSEQFVRDYMLVQSMAQQSAHEIQSRSILKAIENFKEYGREPLNYLAENGLDIATLDYDALLRNAFTPEQIDYISLESLRGQPKAKEIFDRILEAGKAQMEAQRINAAARLAKYPVPAQHAGMTLKDIPFTRELSNIFPSFFDSTTGTVRLRSPGALNDLFKGSATKDYEDGLIKTVTDQIAVYRDTIHVAPQQIAQDAFMARQVQPNAQYVIANMQDVADANPGSLVNLHNQDSQFVTKPFQDLVIPNVKDILEPGFDLPRYASELTEFGAGFDPAHVAALRAKIAELKGAISGYGGYDLEPMMPEDNFALELFRSIANAKQFNTPVMTDPSMEENFMRVLSAMLEYQKHAKATLGIENIFSLPKDPIQTVPNLNYFPGINMDLLNTSKFKKYPNDPIDYSPTMPFVGTNQFGVIQSFPTIYHQAQDIADGLRSELMSAMTQDYLSTDKFLASGRFGFGGGTIKYGEAGYSETKNLVRLMMQAQGPFGLAHLSQHNAEIMGQETDRIFAHLAHKINAESMLHSGTWTANTSSIAEDGLESGILNIRDIRTALYNNLILRYPSTDNQFIQKYPGIFPGRFTRLTKIGEQGYEIPPPPDPDFGQIDDITGEFIGSGVKAPVSNKKAAAAAAGFNFGGYVKMPRFKKGGYLKFKEGGEVPSILHGGEYILNSAAVKKYGLAHLEAMNQMRFSVPSAGFSIPQASYSGSAAGGMTTSTQNVNIYVDNFIGEPEWFNSMMKDYNTKILPKNQKAAGLENRVISTYNGLNRGQ